MPRAVEGSFFACRIAQGLLVSTNPPSRCAPRSMKTIVAVFHLILTILCLAFLPQPFAVVPPPRWWLSRRQHSGRAERSVEPNERWWIQLAKRSLPLKPVSFHYKKKIDATGRPQLGLVAEDVAHVNSDLVIHDKEGKPFVRYDQVNAMLLNEFLKKHRKVEAQQATIAQLKSNAANERTAMGELIQTLGTVLSRLNEQDSKIQQVSVQLKMSDARRVVVDR